MRALLLISALMAAIWASLIALVYLVEALIMKLIALSLLRSVLGMLAYTAWVAAWYFMLMRIAKRMLKRAPDLSAR